MVSLCVLASFTNMEGRGMAREKEGWLEGQDGVSSTNMKGRGMVRG